MGEVSIIGVDIAKSVFQIQGVDADGTVVIRKRIGRLKVLEFFANLPPCLVGMEACATAHQWARELKKLGHDTRLMPPTYVKAYVKRGKNDAADAAAICEAVTRPSMRFVPIKSVEQQSALMLHRTRDLLIRQRTQLINALRAHLAELGLVAAKGHEGLQQLVLAVTESSDERLPGNARFACQAIIAQLHAVQTQINGLDKRVTLAHRANADSKRLEAIPGFGVILSTAVVATMTDPKAFRTGREFAAWIGLVPRQNSIRYTQVRHSLPLHDGRHHFFALRSFNMALSSIASASSFFSLRFSSSKTFSWRASETSSPPYFDFHL